MQPWQRLPGWQQRRHWPALALFLPLAAPLGPSRAWAAWDDWNLRLRRLGISSEKLHITYVKALKLNLAHMVPTHYANPDDEPLVLDSLINQIRPASRRQNLAPVYAFNAEDRYFPGSRSNKSDSKTLSRRQDLLKKCA